MDPETPKEKLLEAIGGAKPRVQFRGGFDPETREYLEALLNQALDAADSAKATQELARKSCRQVTEHLQVQLPVELVHAFHEAMQPMNQSVSEAAARINSSADTIAGLSWGRLLTVAVAVGMGTVLVGGCMVRCTFFDDKLEEAKRYELFGRKVNALILTYKPKEQERVYRWIGSRP